MKKGIFLGEQGRTLPGLVWRGDISTELNVLLPNRYFVTSSSTMLRVSYSLILYF